MHLYPAIDILEGKAVRLRQGDFADKSVYADEPVAAAERWVGDGARRLHVVDLDGARAGQPVSIEHLRRICERVQADVQYGGGMRSLDDIHAALDAGARRVVLGTAAFADAELLEGALERWSDNIAVAVDVRGGLVSTSGWTQQTKLRAGDAVTALRDRGVHNFIYTNVDRDGMLSGPDPEEVAGLSEIVATDQLIYSGGIGALADLQVLVDLARPNLVGVIVGKALYEGCFTLHDAQALLEGTEAAKSS
jgi:phosphoribosylformimino-5-aminoimidazole carboxamide ribotide isomerase